jgi:hypothetical protein
MLRGLLRVLVLAGSVCGHPAASFGFGVLTDAGWYQLDGTHLASNTNYVVRAGLCDPECQRNFFVFDLSGEKAPVEGATLRVFNPSGVGSPGYFCSDGNCDPSGGIDTYTLFDVSTPADVLTSSHAPPAFDPGARSLLEGMSIYADLGTGVVYGSTLVSASTEGTFVEIVLNEEGVAALNASLGGSLAVGGALLTTRDAYVQQFGDSELEVGTEASIQAVPEPATLYLVPPALVVGACCRRRKDRVAVRLVRRRRALPADPEGPGANRTYPDR